MYGDDLSIDRSREPRSIELYPLGGFDFSKQEADYENALGFNLTTESIMYFNQVKSCSLNSLLSHGK